MGMGAGRQEDGCTRDVGLTQSHGTKRMLVCLGRGCYAGLEDAGLLVRASEGFPVGNCNMGLNPRTREKGMHPTTGSPRKDAVTSEARGAKGGAHKCCERGGP